MTDEQQELGLAILRRARRGAPTAESFKRARFMELLIRKLDVCVEDLPVGEFVMVSDPAEMLAYLQEPEIYKVLYIKFVSSKKVYYGGRKSVLKQAPPRVVQIWATEDYPSADTELRCLFFQDAEYEDYWQGKWGWNGEWGYGSRDDASGRARLGIKGNNVVVSQAGAR